MSTKTENVFVNREDPNEQGIAEFQVIDKRPFLDLDKIDKEACVDEKPRFPSFVEELLGKLAETERRFEEKKGQMQEEIARTKTRLESDFARRIEAEKHKMLLPFLDVLDNLERALAATPKGEGNDPLWQGVELTANMFRARLQSHGVEAIPVLNQPFDPNLGQAIGIVYVSDPSQDGVVVDEVLRGYKVGEQLLRPAQVRVGQLQN